VICGNSYITHDVTRRERQTASQSSPPRPREAARLAPPKFCCFLDRLMRFLVSAQALGMFHVGVFRSTLSLLELTREFISMFKRLPGDANHQQQDNGETSPAAYY
jgi:hypothetical protein